MKLKPCEFEEAEYRGPLFNQLHTTNLLWEPGQVFEQYIGIDHAMWTTNPHLHALHGYSSPPKGVSLSRHDWSYIWIHRRRRKKLPSFLLNVFIQAKRPQYGRYAPKALRAMGLKSPFWRFETTRHQQEALERLQTSLKKKAIVCYACPAFHQEALLHKWTVSPQLVEKSTFPDVLRLAGHGAWNYSEPGAIGVANEFLTPSEGPVFLDRLREMIERESGDQSSPINELADLSNAAHAAMNAGDNSEGSIQAQFADGVRELEVDAREVFSGEDYTAAVAFGTVLLFSRMNRLTWMIAGRDG